MKSLETINKVANSSVLEQLFKDLMEKSPPEILNKTGVRKWFKRN